MRYKEVIARFEAPDLEAAEELICDIFFSFKLKGVACDVPIQEPDEGFGTRTLPEPDGFAIKGYFAINTETRDLVRTIQKKADALSGLGIHVSVESRDVDPADWEDAWKDHFDVTPVTDRIVIKPDWKPYTSKPGEIIIHLDPGMAFGTGTHPTTAMCLELMDRHLIPGTRFFDIGTGSGILMIAAAKLGAEHIIGIDTDPTAVRVAAENLEKNQISDQQARVSCTSVDGPPDERFDCIAANIIAQVIVDILPAIKKRMAPEAVGILSGIIQERMPQISNALDACGLKVIEEKVWDEWVALLVCRNRQAAAVAMDPL